jgi:hypothetical protein
MERPSRLTIPFVIRNSSFAEPPNVGSYID